MLESLSPVLAWYDPFGVDVPLNFDNTHSHSLISAGFTRTLNLKNASNYIPRCLPPIAAGSKARLKFTAAWALIRSFMICSRTAFDESD